MARSATASIDLTALRHNLQRVREFAPGRKIIAVVKADGYGHGIIEVARSLNTADLLGVACIEEAIQLRKAGIEIGILLLEGFFDSSELAQIERYDLETVIHHPLQLDQICEHSFKQPPSIWIKLDTGMHRLGFEPTQFKAVYQQLQQSGNTRAIRAMTHLACSDETDNPLTPKQHAAFQAATKAFDIDLSIAASAAIIAWPQTHENWVRPGLMLYGVSPFADQIGANHQLQAAMLFQSKIISIKTIQCGESVGYGASWVAQRESKIGVIAVGYGDGYPRHAPSGTPVLIKGNRVKLAGRVSMDMICVDLTDHPEIQFGDTATLWGAELPVEEIARRCNAIPYQLLCGLTQRVAISYKN
ncbi:MAG: alanine racemase [Pseudomonadales bacterium]|nr:alanine racemase [Pseudomonadales bacterium]